MVDAFRFQKHAGWSSEVLCRKVFPMSPGHRLPTNPPGKGTKISPFILRLLTPALSSFGEERENAAPHSWFMGTMRECLGEFSPRPSPPLRGGEGDESAPCLFAFA